MLPNYLGTYSSALYQIRALEKAFKKQNNGQSVPKMLVLNACIWLARINTQDLHQYSTFFACNNDLCRAMLKTYLGHIPRLLATFEPHRRCLRRVTIAKVAENLSFRCLHKFDWLEQTDKIGCNIFLLRITCAQLCCQCVWEHFPQFFVKFWP